MSSRRTWTVGELAARFDLPTNVLRHWESIGLLAPERDASGYRRYGRDDLVRVAVIVRNKSAGMSLEQIRVLIDGEAEGPAGGARGAPARSRRAHPGHRAVPRDDGARPAVPGARHRRLPALRRVRRRPHRGAHAVRAARRVALLTGAAPLARSTESGNSLAPKAGQGQDRSMRLLVLGGTHHVGRAFVEAGLARGDDVTTVNRGLSGPDTAGAETRHADRLVAGSLAEALGDDEWDARRRHVVARAGRRAGVGPAAAGASRPPTATSPPDRSTPGRSRWGPTRAPRSSTATRARPTADDYAAAKRGGELAVLSEFDGDVTLARAGLILGPYEIVGRMPFWLNRIAAAGPGGRVPAPGPRDRPLQLVDCRDIADWVLGSRPVGTFNTVSRPGHATIGQVLDACNDVTGAQADLVWLTPETIEAAGVAPWTELPIWLPPTGEYAGLHDCDVSAALAAGLSCRPIEQTVADTWAWLQREGLPERPTNRVGTPMDAAAEARLWAAHDRA